MKDAKIAFVWALVLFSFIMGCVFGCFDLAKHPSEWALVAPAVVGFIFSSGMGLIEVFTHKL